MVKLVRTYWVQDDGGFDFQQTFSLIIRSL